MSVRIDSMRDATADAGEASFPRFYRDAVALSYTLHALSLATESRDATATSTAQWPTLPSAELRRLADDLSRLVISQSLEDDVARAVLFAIDLVTDQVYACHDTLENWLRTVKGTIRYGVGRVVRFVSVGYAADPASEIIHALAVMRRRVAREANFSAGGIRFARVVLAPE